MPEFEHQRHKPPQTPPAGRPLIVACSPLRSNVNLSRIVRAASCCGVDRVIATGQAKLVSKIARDGADQIPLEVRRSLPPVLRQLREDGFQLVGLEQTTASQSLFDFRFEPPSVLVVGNERTGLAQPVLDLLDHVVEIPVYGMPYSHNVATAAAMALYEFCRQGGTPEE